jgi:hypothetical protein
MENAVGISANVVNLFELDFNISKMLFQKN